MPDNQGVYDDDPVRWGVIATIAWGVAGLAAGLFIALQLAFPVLNLGLEYTSFGRLRPLHTSGRSEEHTSELQSLMRISYAVFCLKKKNKHTEIKNTTDTPST